MAPRRRLLQSDLRGRRVLIIDDNSQARTVLSSMLSNMAFVVDEAASGQEGIEMVRQAARHGEPYEIAFVDWQMPGLDGVETGKRILALPELDAPPHLVMVTAYGREEVMKQAEESGFENVLIKPVTSVDLVRHRRCRPRRRPRRRRKPWQAGPSFDIDRMRGARVLLVEDNEINQEVAIGQLEDAELFVDLAENGAVAVRMVRRERLRHRADGYANAGDGRHRGDARIRSDPALQALPIIAMTANAHRLRPRDLPAGGHERSYRQADRSRPVVRRSAALDQTPRWRRRIARGSGRGQRPSTAPRAEDPFNDRRDRHRVGAEAHGRQSQALRDVAAQVRAAAGRHGRWNSQGPLAVGDAATAERAAHSLKGAAGTLGATRCRRPRPGPKPRSRPGRASSRRSRRCRSSCATRSRPFGPHCREAAPTNGGGKPPRDPATVVEPLARLKQLLESDDGEAADFIVDAARPVRGADRSGNRNPQRIGRQFRFRGRAQMPFGHRRSPVLNLRSK